MVKSFRIKNIVIGEGIPKICVPIVGTDEEQINSEISILKASNFDIVEWRADYFESVTNLDKVQQTLNTLRASLPDVPLLFTFRTKEEGGVREFDIQSYIKLNEAVIRSGLVDIVDIELFTGDQYVKTLIEEAHKNNVLVVLSNHDFNGTPPKDEIILRLRKAQQLDGDIPKIAVMPRNTKDVITLLDATREMKEQYADRPFITMSMEGIGLVSRLAGEIFGSAITFGTVTKASAPGQIPANELKNILNVIHKNISK